MIPGRISLEGRVAVVAGGGGDGIGGTISLCLAQAGAAVAVLDRDADCARQAVEAIEAAGGRGLAVLEDVCTPEGCAAAVERTVGTLGGLDVLVNVVGGMGGQARWVVTEEWTDAEWDHILSMNLRYVFLMCRAALPSLRASRVGGSIVNIASISGTHSAPQHVAYGAAKAGLVSMTRSLALEYARDGIRANAVAPGVIRTPRGGRGMASDFEARLAESLPIPRPGQPQEIAGPVLFLASDLASYVTGQTLGVDGGAAVRYPIPVLGRSHMMS